MPDGTVLHGGLETYKSVYAMITRQIAVSPADAGGATSGSTTGSTTTTTAP